MVFLSAADRYIDYVTDGICQVTRCTTHITYTYSCTYTVFACTYYVGTFLVRIVVEKKSLVTAWSSTFFSYSPSALSALGDLLSLTGR